MNRSQDESGVGAGLPVHVHMRIRARLTAARTVHIHAARWFRRRGDGVPPLTALGGLMTPFSSTVRRKELRMEIPNSLTFSRETAERRPGCCLCGLRKRTLA